MTLHAALYALARDGGEGVWGDQLYASCLGSFNDGLSQRVLAALLEAGREAQQERGVKAI